MPLYVSVHQMCVHWYFQFAAKWRMTEIVCKKILLEEILRNFKN